MDYLVLFVGDVLGDPAGPQGQLFAQAVGLVAGIAAALWGLFKVTKTAARAAWWGLKKTASLVRGRHEPSAVLRDVLLALDGAGALEGDLLKGKLVEVNCEPGACSNRCVLKVGGKDYWPTLTYGEKKAVCARYEGRKKEVQADLLAKERDNLRAALLVPAPRASSVGNLRELAAELANNRATPNKP